MIREWIESKFIQAVPGAKELGLHRESIAIHARYQRQKNHWTPHLNHTKSTIQHAIDEAPKDRSIMVLGAGDCLDLPVGTLARHNRGTYLVDVVQTHRSRKFTKKYQSLQYILKDVSGYVNDKEPGAKLPKVRRRPGLIISCNMLSQLYLPFVNFPPQDDDDHTIIRAITTDHVTMLKNFPGDCLLIADFRKIVYDKNGETVIDTIPADLLPEPMDQWTWDICPKGELGRSISASLDVGVWKL